MEAAYQTAQSGRQDLVGLLIENLRDRDDSVRFVANIALKRMTGQDFAFRSYAGFHEREAAIHRWLHWHAGIPDARAVTAGTAGTAAGSP